MDALKHYDMVLADCTSYMSQVCCDTGHYHHSEAASSRAELSKQIPPVKGLITFLLHY